MESMVNAIYKRHIKYPYGRSTNTSSVFVEFFYYNIQALDYFPVSVVVVK